MKILFFVVLLAIAAAAALAYLRKMTAAGDSGPWPFHARKPLSVPEQVLYFRLLEALPEHIVLAQVGLSRILGVNKGNNFQAWHNRINRMSADFVVCKKDSTVVAVIELDDASHEASERKAADAKKDRALAAASVPIIRWRAKSLPDTAAIRSAIGQGSTAQTTRSIAKVA
jgi:very-short-patch-repair endonuclease